MTGVRSAFNRRLDATVHPRFRLLKPPRRAFHVCGCTGLVLATVLAMTLVSRRNLSPSVMAGVILSAVATFLVLAMATKIIVGRESLTYYHHTIAVLSIAAGLLAVLRQPFLPYLDVTILGIGLFLVCGRCGCFMAGCCHGRPHRWGVRYTPEHAEAGFSVYLVGVRLFPVQLVESLWVLLIVTAGCAWVWRGDIAGEALASYLVLYGAGRFGFEFVRGDRERPYLGGFSEAQWTSALLMFSVLLAERRGMLPNHDWHAIAATIVVLGMIAVAVRRHLHQTGQLVHPRHIHEVAQALGQVATSAGVHVQRTSLGIYISASQIAGTTGSIDTVQPVPGKGTDDGGDGTRAREADHSAEASAGLNRADSRQSGSVSPSRPPGARLTLPGRDPRIQEVHPRG